MKNDSSRPSSGQAGPGLHTDGDSDRPIDQQHPSSPQGDQLVPGVAHFPRIAIIGAGRVGGALAHSLTDAGYPVTALYSRSEARAERLAASIGASVTQTPAEAALKADLVILAVPDAAIAGCAAQIAEADLRAKAVTHTSGATPVAALFPCQQKRAIVGGFHPFAAIASAEQMPTGIVYGLEADREPLRGWLSGIVAALGGTPLWLRANTDRTRYHASAMLLNYGVTLFADALALLGRYTLDQDAAYAALLGHAQKIVANIEAVRGSNDGDKALAIVLTGPLARGDAAVVADQLQSLTRLDPELAEIYRLLARRTLRLAALRGVEAEKLTELRGVLTDANHNP